MAASPQVKGEALALMTDLYTGNQNGQKSLVNQYGMAERVGFEPKVGSQAVPKLALAGAPREEKNIQEVDGLLPGPAGLLRLATITPALNLHTPGGWR
jgi:hypothetical protein